MPKQHPSRTPYRAATAQAHINRQCLTLQLQEGFRIICAASNCLNRTRKSSPKVFNTQKILEIVVVVLQNPALTLTQASFRRALSELVAATIKDCDA